MQKNNAYFDSIHDLQNVQESNKNPYSYYSGD